MKKSAAFTLLEIMLVLGLLGLIASLVVMNANALITGFDEKPLPDILKKAVREARFLAAKNKEPIFLTFDPETGKLVINDENGSLLESFPTGYEPRDSSLEIQFYKIMPDSGTNSTSFLNPNRKSVDRVAFHPDRSSTPFLVSLKYGLEESVHQYDPFSDAEFEEDAP